MDFQLQIGLSKTMSYFVREEDSAKFLGSGDVGVLSTPAMIAMMENTARLVIEDELPPGFTTVGTKVCISHLAPAPIGAKINVNARLIEQDGRKLVFRVEAFWKEKKIGEGTHERYIVNRDKFLEKIKK